MNHNIFRTAIIAIGLALSVPAAAREAQRLHPKQSHMTTELSDSKAASEQVLAPRVRGNRNIPSEILPAVPRLKAPVAKNASAAMPVVAGGVISSDSWSGAKKYGVYSLSPSESRLIVDKAKATDGGVLKDNIFYAHELEDDDLFGITVYVNGYDIKSAEKVYEGDAFFANRAAVDMTVDPVSGKVYGIFWKDDNMSGYMLATINYQSSTPKVSKIIDLPGDWCALAADNAGNLYGIRREIEGGAVKSSALYLFVDIEQGQVAKIGDTGQQPYYQSSMTYDAAADRMIWNVCPADNTGAIYDLSVTTGVATLLYNLPGNEEIMGMYLPAGGAAENTPAAPTDMTFDFPRGALEGTVVFKAPATMSDGSPISGTLSYTLVIDSEAMPAANCNPGEIVTVPVTLKNSGKHDFSVTVSNDSGKSSALKASFTAGFAKPKDPANVVMTIDADYNATVSWDAVTAAATEGYFAADEVRYRLVQNPGNNVVFDSTDKTSYSCKLPEPDGYTVYNFIVTAIMGSAESKEVRSNSFSVGTIEPPYIEDFASDSALDQFTIIGRWRYNKSGYMYASYTDGDDWLITPAIKLAGGKTYRLSFDAKADWGSFYPEKLEVKYGSSPSAQGMTYTLVEPYDLKGNDYENLSAYITPDADGLYYIGIHNLGVDSWGLFVDNISVEAPMSNSIPAVITDFKAHGDADGLRKVSISFTAPDKTFTGEQLESIDRIEIMRGTELVHSFDSPRPGEALTWTDNSPSAGVNEYSVVSYNSAGASESAKATAFVGLDRPAQPQNLKITEIEDGVVSVSWDRVTTGVHGGPINPDLVTYDVATYINGDMDLNAMYLSDTSVTFRAIAKGSQDYMQFVVFPIIDDIFGEIEGEPAMSDQMIIGTPSNGYRESFRGGMCLTPLAIKRINNGGCGMHTDADGVIAQDGDNGYIAITGSSEGAKAAIESGKIILSDMVDPALTFYTYTLTDPNTGNASRNKIEVAIAEPGKDFTTELATNVSSIGSSAGWHLVSVPLSKYAGKTVIFRIAAEVVNFSYTPIDNIRVGSSIAHDIELKAISAPAHVKAGEDFKVSVLYSNLGTETVESFNLALFADGKEIKSLPCGSIAPGATVARQFSISMHPLRTEDMALQARAILESDGNMNNNAGEVIMVKPVVSGFPAVTDLSGSIDANGKPALQWSEPEYTDFAVPIAMTEDLENADAFATSLDGWTFIDGDKLPTGTFKDFAMPGIADGSLQSFWIVDGKSEVIPSRFHTSFSAVSGSKYLVAMYAKGGRNDDWAISPELSGEMQYISFFAKSYSSSASEEFEVLASSNGTAVEDFCIVGKVPAVPRAWTAYEYLLPAGTKHFAIRYCADDAMMLMIDDIRYNALGKDDRLTLAGFNIYRNGQKVNDKPVEDFDFTDNTATEKLNSYVATAVYTAGESAASNTVSLELSSIAELGSAISISADENSIIISGANGMTVNVFTPDGRNVASLKADATTRIPVTAGIYLVQVNGSTTKLIVR